MTETTKGGTMRVFLDQASYTRVGVQGHKRVKYAITETQVIEDDGSREGGKVIATFSDHDMAEKVCHAMEWQITTWEAN